ncbi:hypothetical protein BDM02DRAFT_3132746 [Thelephora ganbajun]|uniref:Uncharacterized protein n=1 Tax=Thelephora ganbajun TaxID=370292 RepID=A0ACB6Z0B5_THEGA|nr:hypothetical protein BDM02DRAFT_3132746 [Thelephora ganbajun]
MILTVQTLRDGNNKRLNQLGEQVVALTVEFKELSKTMASALEDIKSNGTGGTESIFKHSKPLPHLKPDGFKGLKYWYKAPWSEIWNGKAIVDTEDPILVLFFEDETRGLVPKSKIQSVRNAVKAYFEFLQEKNRAPKSWTCAALDLQIDFTQTLEEEYEFLRYCDRHWKSKQIFMNYYSQWHKGKIKSKRGQSVHVWKKLNQLLLPSRLQ